MKAKKDVEELNAKLCIQLDNLCQFLPQARLPLLLLVYCVFTPIRGTQNSFGSMRSSCCMSCHFDTASAFLDFLPPPLYL